MENHNIEVLLEESNLAIVKLPGRKFPGVVVQGDSLFALLCLVQELNELVEGVEAKFVINELYQHLHWRIRKYEDVLHENEIPLPYAKNR